MKKTRKSGAGRKPVDPATKAKTKTFSMEPGALARLEGLSKGKPLGRWLVGRLGL